MKLSPHNKTVLSMANDITDRFVRLVPIGNELNPVPDAVLVDYSKRIILAVEVGNWHHKRDDYHRFDGVFRVPIGYELGLSMYQRAYFRIVQPMILKRKQSTWRDE